MIIKPVILAGGYGTRLWPVSRETLPKPYIPLFENKTLLEITLKRVISIKYFVKPLIICNKRHNFIVKNILTKLQIEATIILEPEGKGTAAAIYLAALLSNKNEHLFIMPSDHIFSENKYLSNLIAKLSKVPNYKDWILFGIKPTSPSSEYGYIEIDINLNKETKKLAETIYDVTSFKEKPEKNKAEKYLKSKNYFWNSGIFLANVEMITNNIQKISPDLVKACNLAFKSAVFEDFTDELSFDLESFQAIPSNSIDYEIIEKSNNVKAIILDCDWSDVGTWDAISKIKKSKKTDKNIIQVSSSNNFIRSSNRLIATVDIKDCIIIDTPNTTLITKKESSHKVQDIIKKIDGRISYFKTDHLYEQKPWGNFEILYESKVCKVKKLEIKPLHRLSLQYHNFRSEHWLIIKGNAIIHLDGKTFKLKKGESIDIPNKKNHYVHNNTNKPLIIIETQMGTYFGEDDIIRINDPYMR